MIKHSAADERPLTPAELTDMNGALLITGYDTTASMITFGLACMLNTPGQWEKLCADPDIPASSAAEEVVRYLSTGYGLVRQATEDTVVNGQPIRAGEYVVVAVQAADRDTALHPDADRLDVTRKRPARTSATRTARTPASAGQIARIELTTVLRALPRRVPGVRIAVPFDEVVWKKGTMVRGPAELPVAWS